MKNATLKKGLIDCGVNTQRKLAEILKLNENYVSAIMNVDMTEEQQAEILEKVKAVRNG